MSRSTKKPYITDQQHSSGVKEKKRRANRVVRKSEDIMNGNSYKKESCSWNIKDWSFHNPKDKKAYRK